MALVNANYEFIYVDVGKQGRMSDSGAFEWTSFYKKLTTNNLNFPDNSETTEQLNFVIIGDSAFSLQNYLLKPYPDKDLTYEKKFTTTDCPEQEMLLKMLLGCWLPVFEFFIQVWQCGPKALLKLYWLVAFCTIF